MLLYSRADYWLWCVAQHSSMCDIVYWLRSLPWLQAGTILAVSRRVFVFLTVKFEIPMALHRPLSRSCSIAFKNNILRRQVLSVRRGAWHSPRLIFRVIASVLQIWHLKNNQVKDFLKNRSLRVVNEPIQHKNLQSQQTLLLALVWGPFCVYNGQHDK